MLSIMRDVKNPLVRLSKFLLLVELSPKILENETVMSTPKAVALILVCLALTGCGDPATDRLEVGSTAVVSEKDGAIVEKSSGREIYPKLAPGVKVTIGHDPGDLKTETGNVYAAGEEMSGYRKVKIVVETGDYRGMSGDVSRKDLRPSK